MLNNILFRVDADSKMGTGHLMRCLALAQEFKRSGSKVIFLCRELSQNLVERVRNEGFDLQTIKNPVFDEVNDAKETLSVAKVNNTHWLIVDGYQFKDEFQTQISSSNLHFLLFDDYGHADSYTADIILNQNIYATEEFYIRRKKYSQLLLGSDYTLIRDEFLPLMNKKKNISDKVKNILLTFGGSDQQNCTEWFLQELDKLKTGKFHIRAIVGSMNPNLSSLKILAEKSKHQVEIIESTNTMTQFMEEADLAITAGGSTCWELCLMGVPFLSVVTADNQLKTVDSLEKLGLSSSLGDSKSLNAHQFVSLFETIDQLQERKKRSDLGQKQIDGLGRKRVLQAISEYKKY